MYTQPPAISKLVKVFTRSKKQPDGEYEYSHLWFDPATLKFYFQPLAEIHLNEGVADRFSNLSGARAAHLNGHGYKARTALYQRMLETKSDVIRHAYECCRLGQHHNLNLLLTPDESRAGTSYDYLAALMAALVHVAFEVELFGIEHPSIHHDRRDVLGLLPQ